MNPAIHRARDFLLRKMNDRKVLTLARQINESLVPDPDMAPVVIFNASTRLGGISQNAAFATLTGMALQLSGVPVHYFGCRAGLSRCNLGTVLNGSEQPPPCQTCIAQSEVLYANANTRWFDYKEDQDLTAALHGLNVPDLETFHYLHENNPSIPLGLLTLPSIRWTLRIHHLENDKRTRNLFRAFISSAFNVIQSFGVLMDELKPQSLVLFNGIAFPEAAARWAARQRGIPVVTHEVAHQPMTAYFSHGEVTAYPVSIPPDFELDDLQNSRLDRYLEKRFQGKFSMAGLEFWPEMQGLDQELLTRIESHRQLVPVFTNVIFDTSQVHANVIFEGMFAWLDQIHSIILAHPETFFVIRAHPDELRPGSRKQSLETVDQWVQKNQLASLPNVHYVSPLEYLSSYALIQRAKFVMVYNSTIGLETALMGKPVLSGGKARYTQVPCVYLPKTPVEHRELAEKLLTDDQVLMPADFHRNARRFQYYQLWRTPLPFDEFLEPHTTRGYVNLKDFALEDLHPDQSTTMRVIVDGILSGIEFLMPEPTSN